MNENTGCCWCFLFISICIGIPTFLLGCNKEVSNVCVAYDVFVGKVYDYQINERTCSECVSRDKHGKCKRYTYHTCYDAYVLSSKYVVNQTTNTFACKLQTASGEDDENSAKKSMKKYNIGDIVHWYKKKSDCFESGEIRNNWYVGVVFLSFSGFLILILLCFLFLDNAKVFP